MYARDAVVGRKLMGRSCKREGGFALAIEDMLVAIQEALVEKEAEN